METQILSKITIKECYGKIDQRNLPKDNSIMPLMTVIGIVRALKPGEMTRQLADGTDVKDKYVAFLGDFRAVTKDAEGKNDKTFESGKCFLPRQASDLIEGKFSKEINELAFAFEIGVRYDAKSATGYVYVVKPLLQPEKSNPLMLLEQKLQKPA